MGLTNASVGAGAMDAGFEIRRQNPNERIVALAGNPNVGKSTVFNALTGMKQHTGNWPGKTVCNAQGRCQTPQNSYVLVDIPGTYSLAAHSAEEEVARAFLCFGGADAAVVVCDATCLERNLNLVLQIMELGLRVIVCVNLLDEARRKRIRIDLEKLSERLGVPVVGVVARHRRTLRALTDALDAPAEPPRGNGCVRYPDEVERAIDLLLPVLSGERACGLNPRWLALRVLEGDEALHGELRERLGAEFFADAAIASALQAARELLRCADIDDERLRDMIASAPVAAAETLCRGVVSAGKSAGKTDRRLDRILTGRVTAYPIMLLLLAGVFWLTIVGANYPSELLSRLLFGLQTKLTALLCALGAPDWLHGALVHGVYRVLAWVVSVMLPPMAIFFPLFTLLEDAGYLPRVAFNLDCPFRRCRACGKQALTMCMGFGCNAAGVVGCRIIDSPRERLLAVLTNSFVPCNGRFPTLIAVITMFFALGGQHASAVAALGLTVVVLLGVGMTFAVTRLLSASVLRGVPSSFVLELPPYRPPQVGRVIVRSVFDRTLFVLGRAAAVAAPAGLVIWLAANVAVGGRSLLEIGASALDPIGRLMGLDGVILMAFILGFPANEIVVPIMVMAYLSQGTLAEVDSLTQLRAILVDHGWTSVTALNTVLFMLMHWPCSTTLLTVHRETGSWRWTALAAAIPTVCGVSACVLVRLVATLCGV